ncbi:unnamed protein product [Urochloa humidicola]
MKRRRIETLTKVAPSESPALSSVVDLRWVMLTNYGCPGGNDNGSDYVIADANTVADSCTSKGQRFRISFGIAAPPALSFIYSDTMGGAAPATAIDYEETRCQPPPQVIAAHGDLVLFSMASDYFLYRTGGAAHLPSLSLIPAGGRCLALEDTGLLRRGAAEDDLLVVQLKLPPYIPDEPPRESADLRVLRPGNNNWWQINRAVPIVDEHSSRGGVLPDSWETAAAVPVGDRYMCWVHYLYGFLLCDMADKASTPKLHYVRLPADLTDDEDDDEDEEERYNSNDYRKPTLKCSRNMCAASASSVRLVSIDPRCCCGGRGTSFCRRSKYAFTVTTWTLALRMDGPMVWVKEGVLDSDELWALPEYGSLPRVPLQYPFVSSDDPDIVCFVVFSDYRRYRYEAKKWIVKVDMGSKTLQSVIPCISSFGRCDAESIVTAKLYY